MAKISTAYPALFDQGDAEDGEAIETPDPFLSGYYWWNWLYALSNGDYTKFVEIEEWPLLRLLNSMNHYNQRAVYERGRT